MEMIPVDCHHLEFRSGVKFKSFEDMELSLDKILTALVDLKFANFKSKSSSANYVKQFELIHTFRNEIDLKYSQYNNGNCTLISITFHGKFFERLGEQYSYKLLIDKAKTCLLQPRELHFKARLPVQIADFPTIHNHFKEESYTTKSTVYQCSSDSKTWSLGKRSTQGSRISFYDAAARHEEAADGETDIELQLYGKNAINTFIDGMRKTSASLEELFFSNLLNRISFKDLQDNDSNISRRDQANFWETLADQYTKISIPKREKPPQMQRRVAVAKGKMYSNLLQSTPHIWLDALEQFLDDQQLLEAFTHRCLEKLQMEHLKF